jgi:hypothetical protein
VDDVIQPGSVQLMDAAALEPLFTSLRDAGFSVIGPTVLDGAIVLAELQAAGDLPFGWGVRLEPGGYRLRRRSDSAAFGHSAGPGSWKQFLHPPRGSSGPPAWPTVASRSRPATRHRPDWRSSACGRVTFGRSRSRIGYSAAGTATRGTGPAAPRVAQQPVPAVAHPQAGHLARPVRQLRLCRMRAVHRVVPGGHRPHRGGGGAAGGSVGWHRIGSRCPGRSP